MGLVTLKQFAHDQGISYEAVRKQIKRYAEELSGHITKQDRTQYLDQWAIEFLTERRRENPVVLVNMDQSEENKRLQEQIETLRVQLMTAQNELLKEKDRVIELQNEAKTMIEDRAKYTALLEDNKAKEEKLKEAGDQIDSLRKEKEADQQTIQTIQKEADDLRKERDEARTEAKSFKKTIFGFYRKKPSET